MQFSLLQPYAPHLLSILRIIASASFFTHGTIKLFGWPGPFEHPMNTLLYVAATMEVFGGLLLIAGAFTRPLAFLMSGLMAFAYFMVHGSRGFFPALNHGEAAMLFCFIYLYIAAAGPGPWSVDALTGRTPSPLKAATS